MRLIIAAVLFTLLAGCQTIEVHNPNPEAELYNLYPGDYALP